MESTSRYSPSFDVQPRERPKAQIGNPVPPPEHYGHVPVEVDGEHPAMAHRFEENSPCSSPVDHGPMDCDEQRHAMAPSLKEESHEKQKSFRQWTKQHKSTIGTIMCLYFIGTFETRLACI
jgi:hypothetical protein